MPGAVIIKYKDILLQVNTYLYRYVTFNKVLELYTVVQYL